MRPTSREVAKLAGVSRTTVSYVLNKKSGGGIKISDETRNRVLEAVSQLNYSPSRAAITLKTNKSNLIALMIPHIETPFHPIFASRIQGEAEKYDLDTIIYSTRDNYDRENDFVDQLIGRGVDGVIIQSYRLSEREIERLVSTGIAVVIIGNRPTHPFADNIIFREDEAVEEVVTYLVQKGHHRIGTIAGPTSSWCGTIRTEGYRRSLQQAGIPIDKYLIYEADFFDGETAEHCMQAMFALSEPPTAIFAACDLFGVRALLYALDHGMFVPDDIAIVGFNDLPLAQITRPQLTTVHIDIDQLGSAAVDMLVDRIGSAAAISARIKVLEYSIVFRDSA